MSSSILKFIRGTADAGPCCCNRDLEWIMGIAMVSFGAGLMFWPNSLLFGNLYQVLRVINELTLAILVLYIGLVRIGMLFANGVLPWVGPIIRSCCATVGAAIFLQLALALALNSTPPMPPGTFIFASLALGELLSAFRAASDARDRRREP